MLVLSDGADIQLVCISLRLLLCKKPLERRRGRKAFGFLITGSETQNSVEVEEEEEVQ
jgi:hypothetical protein